MKKRGPRFRVEYRWTMPSGFRTDWRGSLAFGPSDDRQELERKLRRVARTNRVQAKRPHTYYVPTVWRIVDRRSNVVFQTRYF